MKEKSRNGLRFSLLAILGAAWLASSAGAAPPASQAAAKTVTSYQSQIDFEGVGVSVLVNGLPILTDTSGQSSGGTIITQYMLDEPNHITIIITPLKGAAVPSQRAFVSVKVLSSAQSADGRPGPVNTAYQFHWKQTQPPSRLPSPINGTLPPVLLPHPLNWQNAPRTPIGPADKAEINAQIKRLHDALASKNLAQVKSLLAAKTENFAQALSMTAPDMEASQRRFFESSFGNPHWRMKPINYNRLQYHPGAGGRVIHVLNPNGSDPLSAQPDSHSGGTSFDLFLARVNGHWTFVI